MELSNEKVVEFIKKNLIESLSNTTTHGIPKIMKSDNRFTQIMWLLFVVGSSALCGGLIAESVISYLEYDVNTKIRSISDLPTIYPTITVCNKFMFTTEFAYEYLKNITTEYGLTNIFDYSENGTMSQLSIDNQTEKILETKFYAATVAVSKRFSDEDRKKLGSSIESFIIGCKFAEKLCSLSDFIWKFDNFQGNCFKFNSGFDEYGNPNELRMPTRSGRIYGLTLLLYVDMVDELKTVFPNIGATIKIDNNSYEVTGNDLSPVDLSPGYEFNIVVDRIYSYKLPKPYSNCDLDLTGPNNGFNSYLYKAFLDKNYQYKQQSCIDLCYQSMLIKNCNCSDIECVQLFDNVDVCQTDQEIECLYDIYYDKFLAKNYIRDNCLSLCPKECNSTEYKFTMSFSKFANDEYLSLIKNNAYLIKALKNKNITIDDLKNNLIQLNVYYETMAYTVITEKTTMDIVSLLSSIGGTLSLFLGLSILSFVEILEFLVQTILIIKKKNNKVQNVTVIKVKEMVK